MSIQEDTAPKARTERLPPLPPPDKVYKPTRKRFHLAFFLCFVAAPFTNLMRFDIPRQRFYFAGQELWISEFAIIFFALMFLMFVIAASAIIHGRIYCSYACPQMIFSEWSQGVERWAKRLAQQQLKAASARIKNLASRGLFYTVLLVASVFLAFVFTSYFVEPRDLLGRLLHFDLVTVGGITGAVVTVITFLDFTLVRQKFCTTVCPYGYIQGMLQDKHTLLVAYQDGVGETKDCIECKKCVRVCEMGIDIRQSPYQIECVHCGDCIDACEDILRKVGKPGLIHYAWGDAPKAAVKEAWYLRWGFRDAKRVVILLIMTFYLVGLALALSFRRPVLVEINPDRSTLFKVLEDGRAANLIRLKLANRTGRTSQVRLWVEGLPGADLALPANPVVLKPGEVYAGTVELRAPFVQDGQDVHHIRILAQAEGARKADAEELTFITPLKRN
ncbi:4Fe-4S binding protein [Geothrix sp. PMB-07]|uniref:4Fe-4S binding protein n=1 Tax=Geothrix sp. PMB-07 TaxID=3068640 RepID=UPI002741ECC9|nr:4Fe-4S binding protein [Geothrix sp. PMB-07]WLT30820.1 4Fe-4S binding protein [Geothrix sp. PMB-07]